jgi:uncharacterized membrane protein YphA (DoxX/SURF4 family)
MSRWQGFLDWKGHSWLGLAARLYLAWVFLMACWFKIMAPASFAMDVATYDILPLSLINAMALILPWVELFAGVMLLVGLRVRAASLLVAGMMVVFIIALGMALAKGLDMSCGCFASSGAEEDPISYLTMLRDGGWLAVALFVLFFDRRPLGLERVPAIERRFG